MRIIRFPFACFILLCFAVSASAHKRQTPPMVLEDVVCRVAAVLKTQGNIVEVRIDRGQNDGLVFGWKGKAYTVADSKSKPVRTFDTVGTSEVLSVEKQTATARVRLTTKGVTFQVGDAVEVRARVPQKSERSLLWRLACLHIKFLDNYKKPIADYRELYADLSAENNAALMAKMIEAQSEVVEFVVNTEIDAPRKTGRYTGRKASDILKATTPQDLEDFFKFVLSYPGKYIGKDWKVSETFATWIINDAPPGEEEVADKLIAAKTPAERTKLFEAHKALILKEDWFDAWQKRAQNLSDHRRFAEAHALISAALEGCDLLKRPQSKGWLYFSSGYTFSDEQKYREAAAAYNTAIAFFRAQPKTDKEALRGLAYSINNKGVVLSSLGRPKDSYAAYAESLKIKRTIGKDVSLATAYQGMGETAYAMGRYAESLLSFGLAAKEWKTQNDTHLYYSAMRWRASTLAKLGRSKEAIETYAAILKSQRAEKDSVGIAETLIKQGDSLWSNGRFPEALIAYREAAGIREELHDKKGLAEALNGVGRLCFNQGDLAGAQDAHHRALVLARETGDKAGQARALREIGDILQKRGDTPNALENYTQSLELYRTVGNRIGEADVTDQIAYLQSGQKLYADALQSYKNATALYRAADAKEGLARSLYNQGVCSQNLTDNDTALDLYQQAFTLRMAIGAKADAAETEASLAELLGRKQKFEEALARLKHAQTLAEQADSRALLVQIYGKIGGLEAAQFRSAPAKAAYEKALALARDPKVKDKRAEAQQLMGLADLQNAQGNYNQALSLYLQSIALSEAAQNRAELIGALRGMGWVYRSLGESAKALACQQKSLALAQESKDEFAQAEACYSLAALSSDFGDTKRAFQYAEQSRKIYAQFKHEFGLMTCDNAEGVYLNRQGDTEGARQRFEQSLAVAEKLHAKRDIVIALENLGEVESSAKKFTLALPNLKRAYTLSLALGDPVQIASVRTTLGRAYREQGENLSKQGKAAEAEKSYADAENLLVPTLKITANAERRSGRAYALREIGRLQTQRKQYPAAKLSLDEAAKLGEQLQDKHLLWETYQAQSLLYQAQNNLPASVNALRRSVAIVEQLQQGVAGGDTGMEKFLNSKVSLYEMMAELLGRLAEKETDPAKRKMLANDALQAVGKARFQALNSQVIKAQDTGDDKLDAAARQYHDAVQKQGQLEREKTDAVKAGNVVKSDALDVIMAKNDEELTRRYVQVAQSDPDFAARLKFDPRALTESAANLPDNVRLLVCFPGQDDLHLWVFDKTGIRVWHREKIGRKELYGLVQQFRASIDQIKERVVHRETMGSGFGTQAETDPKNPAWYKENVRELHKTLTALYSHLIAPVAKELENTETLLVLPYGQLCYLPFETLAHDSGLKTEFLGETARISYLTSENHLQSVLRSLEGNADNSNNGKDCYVAFADPRGRLGSALEEAQEIAGLFPASEIHSKASGTANKESVYTLRPDCTILHFATHGWLNSTDPNQTFLEMGIASSGAHKVEIESEGSKVTCDSDGALTQLEIYPRLRKFVKSFRTHHIRLVTLSACETALAQGSPEAEVLGMPDAFALAGAASVLASQWSVETYSTTDLMISFYEKLIKDKQTKADALYHARQTLTADPTGRYAHPYYWAAFVLYGDWR